MSRQVMGQGRTGAIVVLLALAAVAAAVGSVVFHQQTAVRAMLIAASVALAVAAARARSAARPRN
ncbi:hypothetical protein GCM10010211_77620 [Streptomyces albospinus]|uniref:Uncharacterized protein n=1 Tax=Streptomyces albospinus TaxID=285515 RepID=A0ABQ2VPT3_9ACTN|nr:hypothetical protein GCM10010211_77620 [Streptomyces albospinus]